LVEKLVGPARTLVIYGASTILGSFASSLTDPLAVGASTGVFGLMAASAAIQLRHGHSLPRAFQLDRQSWLFLVIANAALPLLIPSISWAGHLGGALAGGITAAVVARSGESIDGSAAGGGTRGLAALLVVVHLLGLLQAAHFFVSPLDFPPIPPHTRS
jgi:membrane associated rhomboid family serine protease